MTMDSFEKVNTVEDLFKELDESKFSDTARQLASYRRSLMKEGFTRRESLRLVEAHSKFLYDATLDELMQERRNQEEEEALFEEEEFSGVDEDDPEEYDQ